MVTDLLPVARGSPSSAPKDHTFPRGADPEALCLASHKALLRARFIDLKVRLSLLGKHGGAA